MTSSQHTHTHTHTHTHAKSHITHTTHSHICMYREPASINRSFGIANWMGGSPPLLDNYITWTRMSKIHVETYTTAVIGLLYK